jgi:hypothetical protein
MKAIVIVFTLAMNGQGSSEALVPAALETMSKRQPKSPAANANRAQLSNGERTTAPFWTWFVENPRPSNA